MDFNKLEEDFGKLTSFQDIADRMPDLIKKGIEVFGSPSEREVFCYTAITTLSSLMTKTTGTYNGKAMGAMLYLGVIAKPASNKDVINHGIGLIKKVSSYHSDLNKTKFQEYKNNVANGHDMPKPGYISTLISPDISKAKMIEQLNHNAGSPSVLLADEIDIVVEANKGEHGTGLSYILRSAYHHGRISQQLKGGNQHYVIDNPQLAVVLAGTHRQMASLIGSIENGLYSRFLMVNIEDGASWQDVSPNPDCANPSQTISELSEEIFSFFEYLNKVELQIELTNQQWNVINSFGETFLGRLYNLNNEYLSSIVKRYAQMAVKIAMVFTAVRYFEEQKKGSKVIVEDCDFITAFLLMRRGLNHSIAYFKTLPGGGRTKEIATKQAIVTLLPNDFTRAEFIKVAQKYSVPERTADRWLKDFTVGNIIQKLSQGNYSKKSMANSTERQIDEEDL